MIFHVLQKCIEDISQIEHSLTRSCISQTTAPPQPTAKARQWKQRSVLGAGRFGKVMLVERKTGYGNVERAAIVRELGARALFDWRVRHDRSTCLYEFMVIRAAQP